VGIYKRGEVYWYKFMWLGKAVRESTKQGNDKVARQMEAAHRTSLAKGEVGIREKKLVPTLAAFLEKRIEPWASRRSSWIWYRSGMRALLRYKPLSNSPSRPDSRRASRRLCGSPAVSRSSSWLHKQLAASAA
jgi:hypothetical protein